MENFMEILAGGFDFGNITAYLQIATGQVTLDSLFASFFEGLTVFFQTIFGNLA